ncbi:TolC family protein [Dyadobacter sp. CY345]|uniref:TolC family protein n=1 Tax=Dyadobacter sp. CY345 TaxID=2909335 RepID=UPI001F45493D|nr:TolC family protein [Dyadobacter sp. CY345]MCF2444143.1 TolC family protein [Dyadobacter sp. CY345]
MRYAVILFFSFFIVQNAQAQESLARDISYDYLEKLLAVCKKNYPKIKMFEDRVSVAEYGVKRAKLSYFDIFSAGYLYSPNNSNATSGTASFLGGYQLGFFANVGSLLQKPSIIKQAKGEFAAAKHDKEAFDLSMEAEVKKRYFTYVQKVAVLKIRSGAILDVENMLTIIKHRFEKGEETLDNYNKALILQSDHVQNIINAEADVLNAKSNLEELLGQKLEEIK